ncbi:DUF4145 domain-containing protein [Bifidobacterium kimbladii]|uniref:DUF4145 domain-containing protein n=2 Tax=Bifidobacterium TaxID=1678 RepID=A0A0F4L5Y4_9BIFI|nr:DUF4145 domain-containing protein [Bifidobacterium asteroides]KJY52976.1 hypothetical protein JF69_00450 [Bifidobacterium asteroides]
MGMKNRSAHKQYCWHCDDIEAMTIAVSKGQEDRLTGNDGNDRWHSAYPSGGLRNNADYICFVYVCNRCGYPTVERREYNHPQKGSVGDKADLFIFTPHDCGVIEDKQLEAAYDEVWDCFSCKAYKATVIMARSVLENIINGLIGDDQFHTTNRGRRDKGLKEKIDIAEKKGVIPNLATENVKAIKCLGDSSTHNITADITEEDAKAVIRLLKDVVHATYESESERKQVTDKADAIRKQQE